MIFKNKHKPLVNSYKSFSLPLVSPSPASQVTISSETAQLESLVINGSSLNTTVVQKLSCPIHFNSSQKQLSWY